MPQPALTIRAEATSDDLRVNIPFDASPWFREASYEAIRELHVDGYDGGKAKDLARVMAFRDFDHRVNLLFDYIKVINKIEAEGAVGFSCYINEKDVKKWLSRHKRRLCETLTFN